MPESDPTHCEADGRGRHWLPKREGAHEVGRTASGYLPLQHSYQPALIPISLHWFLKVRTGIIVSQPCNPGSRALARPTAKRHMPPLQSQPLSPHHSLQAATRKSPAIRTCLLWLSAGDKAGRCGDFERTCQTQQPLSNVWGTLPWRVIFDQWCFSTKKAQHCHLGRVCILKNN